MQCISRDKLIDFSIDFLTRKGIESADAEYIASVAVDTEAFGITTHGLAILGSLDHVLEEDIDATAQPLVVRETAASALIDGNNGIGILVMRKAVELGTLKAREQGVSMIFARNTSWIGALGIHLIPLAEKGFLAELAAQTSTCRDCAPVGGIDARFSTNPIALIFPTGADPVLADMSTATVSMGAVGKMCRRGQKASEDIFLDEQGTPTNDPHVLDQGGTILFMGGEYYGHKGYGLSLWCEALTAAGGGDCNNPQAKSRQSFCLTVINPEAFAGREYYDQEMARFIGHVKSSRRRPGIAEIRLPGERGFRAMREAAAKGIPLEDHRIEQLGKLAKEYDLPNPLTE